MTLKQTRQLGIEFERRLQTISPSFKIQNKVDTEDIYSFLNQFQKQYIDSIYAQNDQITSNSRASILAEDVLRTLTKHKIEDVKTTPEDEEEDESFDFDNLVFELPDDYYKYIRSVSHVSKTYRGVGESVVSNILLKQSDANMVINQYYDKNRILRNPVVILIGNTLKIIHDQYTDIDKVDITYIKRPNDFSILNDTPCELPYECFDTLVSGAVELYIRHITGLQSKQNEKQDNNEERRNTR